MKKAAVHGAFNTNEGSRKETLVPMNVFPSLDKKCQAEATYLLTPQTGILVLNCTKALKQNHSMLYEVKESEIQHRTRKYILQQAAACHQDKHLNKGVHCIIAHHRYCIGGPTRHRIIIVVE